MKNNNIKSLVSLALGVVSIITPYFGLIIGIVGVIFSNQSINEIKISKEIGKEYADVGKILSILGICIQAFVLLGAI